MGDNQNSRPERMLDAGQRRPEAILDGFLENLLRTIELTISRTGEE